MELLNKVALITGASSGIGEIIAQKFLAEGANVFGCGIENKANIKNEHFQYIQADLTDYNEANKVVEECVTNFNRIDILVNCAGITGVGSIENTSSVDFKRQFDVNVFGLYNITKLAIKYLKQAKNTSIINIASELGIKPVADRIAYCPAKSAVIMLTQCLAIELGPNVRVNSISPALTETPMTKSRFENSNEPDAIRKEISDRYILKRMGEPSDIADGALFLASSKSSFITGDNLAICGGGHIHYC